MVQRLPKNMSLTDYELFAFAGKLYNKTVLITGAANGIGKSIALTAGSYGAKLVLGDIDAPGIQATCREIRAAGGQAVGQTCDVSSWDDQVALFRLAITSFGKIHVVIPNAGINERKRFNNLDTEDLGNGPQPTRPDLGPLEINLVSVIYTARLAVFYLRSNPEPGKAIVFLGSIASFMSLPPGSLYVASKHGVIGFAKNLALEARTLGIRITTVCPWFADTDMIYPAARQLIAGLPMVQIRHVVGAAILGASDPDTASNGSVYVIPDDIGVFKVDGNDLDLLSTGMYNTLKQRLLGVL